MKPVIIIAIAFVLLIPISALGQEFEYEAIKAQERFEQEYSLKKTYLHTKKSLESN